MDVQAVSRYLSRSIKVGLLGSLDVDVSMLAT